ncbi:pyridoxamine 5'-phosphate oxidase family protein [Actinocorallia populi]|uniref:pyridoxamine 5'-phosphate oxidase family protein n=1 Tax=Actinocorallia populi TaxID=2079200 RepID=UPI000D097A96|nr:pyridoxamine 5'-phosphate oxidase family protein [Actinocorallia populi]
MGKTYERIDANLKTFIEQQAMYFVATAPSAGGHVNVSPKGYAETFAIIDERTVAYLDMNGSGAETIAHLRENGRITFMFCSFERTPKILRLYGSGRTVLPHEPEWNGLAGLFPEGNPSIRAIIVAQIDRIADSCGYGVPFMEVIGPRDMLKDWGARKSPETLAKYRSEKNRVSIDGLPAIDV